MACRSIVTLQADSTNAVKEYMSCTRGGILHHRHLHYVPYEGLSTPKHHNSRNLRENTRHSVHPMNSLDECQLCGPRALAMDGCLTHMHRPVQNLLYHCQKTKHHSPQSFVTIAGKKTEPANKLANFQLHDDTSRSGSNFLSSV